ncbi:MAG: hypothetical protein QGH80_01855 [Acidimicrobiales bacterium]|nr:hypothetical protein [Acidimicrobiales bacterium]
MICTLAAGLDDSYVKNLCMKVVNGTLNFYDGYPSGANLAAIRPYLGAFEVLPDYISLIGDTHVESSWHRPWNH